MLLVFISCYFILTILIGVFSSRLIRSSSDFILAGRKLPLIMATTTVFATWFGSETVLGASSQMAEGGLLSVIEDPFGASLCLILAGLFFARPLYRMKLLSFGDYYREVFGKRTELLAGICLIVSYFGWIAAQMVAMGLILNIVSGMNISLAIMLSSLAVIIYTYIGGMWAISITDFIQTIIIIAGIFLATVVVIGEAGGITAVLDQTPAGFFNFFPEKSFSGWTSYIAAWITIGLGSIPQQDVYQRIMSSRSENIAVKSALIGGFMYLSIALLPLVLGLAARILVPQQTDPQYMLPRLILDKTGTFTQILFFGGLLSAIMSTASGALLAPAVILSENIIRPRLKNISDARLLRITRLSVIIIAVVSLGMALLRKNIYELVGEASAISLVSLFVPLTAGLFFKSNNGRAALLSMLSGLLAWLSSPYLSENFPPILTGLLISIAAYAAGSRIFPDNRY